MLRVVVAAEGEEQLDESNVRLWGEELSTTRQAQLDAILEKYRMVMKSTPGETDLTEHTVDTADAKPIQNVPYRLPPQWKDSVRSEVEELVRAGIVVPSTSPWSSPIVPIRNPTDLCGCALITGRLTPDPYYMLLIEEILDKIGDAKFLSKMDLSNGFYQVPLKEDAQLKSAFITPFRKYQFQCMPFGMHIAPAMFQWMMDVVLGGLEEMSAPYIDDILVFSRTWEEHLEHIEAVLERFKQAGLTVKPSKCEWGKQFLEYLGCTMVMDEWQLQRP